MADVPFPTDTGIGNTTSGGFASGAAVGTGAKALTDWVDFHHSAERSMAAASKMVTPQLMNAKRSALPRVGKVEPRLTCSAFFYFGSFKAVKNLRIESNNFFMLLL